MIFLLFERKKMAEKMYGTVNVPSERAFVSGRQYDDPFNNVEVDVVFIGPGGKEWKVPAFWAGEQEWRVRFAAPEPGEYSWRTVCTDKANPDLHGREGSLEVEPYLGGNPLYARGGLEVSRDRRYLQHRDGTPFLWLGDTWWMGLCERLRWPDEFQLLTADRVEKGFSIVQIVAGLYPDMEPLDPRGRNEAGLPWQADFSRINPAYFDAADKRIQWLVRSGLVPCMLGCWGYYILAMGTDRMKRHWRYLIARWSAYPVVWCLAGEGRMPYYLSSSRKRDLSGQMTAWTDLGRFVQETDPFDRPVTIHPDQIGRDQVEDDSVLDFDMLQTGHNGYDSIPSTVEAVRKEVAREPRMPVVNGEVCYEGIFGCSWQDIQRYMFWACVLSGTCGFTYGANGIWQFNRPEEVFGPSPHGGTWGNRSWRKAYRLPGSLQVGIGREILMRFEWWRFEPHPEWMEPHASEKDYRQPFAAGIPGEVMMIYLPQPVFPWGEGVTIKALNGRTWTAEFIDPRTGKAHPAGPVQGKEWKVPTPPTMEDWLLVLTV